MLKHSVKLRRYTKPHPPQPVYFLCDLNLPCRRSKYLLRTLYPTQSLILCDDVYSV